MLVKYNATSGTFGVPFSDVEGLPSVKDRSPIVLMPGWNDVPFEDWPFIEANLELAIENGDIELKFKEGEDDEGKPKRIQLAIGEVHAMTAKKIIGECFNIFDLDKWRDDPKLSSELRNAAEIQYKKIMEYEGR